MYADEYLGGPRHGAGGFVCGEQVTRFYVRPDVAYVPIADAPPLEWAPTWLRSNDTARVRAFVQAAEEAGRSAGG